jgi:signal transduction histidine kinase
MIEIINISLENEMDLVLAHKRSMKVAEKVGLTTATQTTFATAVSEIARTVIEHTDKGMLYLGLEQNKTRYSLVALVTYDSDIRFTNNDSGYFYAQKLVPEFLQSEEEGHNRIEMKIGVPRSLKLDPGKIAVLKKAFAEEEPINAYEEIKQRNVTLNKLAEVKEEELRQSRIIDEKKTEFMSIASHEIKTPITIIKAYTQMARGLGDQCSPQVTKILEKVDAQSSKLLSLVQQLLDVSKMENGSLQYNREPVPLNQFITDMVAVIQNILPHHQVITNLTDDVVVDIDKLRMEQVFSNLLGNAAKYSGKNTQIHIECRQMGDHVIQIAVSDQGIGLSPGSMASVFDKFYRDKDVIQTHSGLGMGLYISSKIVNDHGGSIGVRSKEGEGSTFFFTLPAHSSTPDAN